jgi:hypothetical protein
MWRAIVVENILDRLIRVDRIMRKGSASREQAIAVAADIRLGGRGGPPSGCR